jgi:hypothetical protein
MTFSVNNDTNLTAIDTLTGWYIGTSNMRLDVSADISSRGLPWPANYELTFAEPGTFLDTTMFNKFPVPLKL